MDKKIDDKSSLKEWRRPSLRRLPIASAAGGMNLKPGFNEGVGKGKANAAASIS
jgi:hypothetical protein